MSRVKPMWVGIDAELLLDLTKCLRCRNTFFMDCAFENALEIFLCIQHLQVTSRDKVQPVVRCLFAEIDRFFVTL